MATQYWGHHIILLHPASVLTSATSESVTYYAGLSYEQLILKDKLGLKILARASTTAGIYTGGLQVKWYPTSADGMIK